MPSMGVRRPAGRKPSHQHLPSRSVIRATVSEMYSSFAGLQGTISPESLCREHRR